MPEQFISHHGILGMKWGARRYQNKDGSLTRAGQSRYTTPQGRIAKKEKAKARRNAIKKETPDTEQQRIKQERAIKAVKIGASVATGLIASNVGALVVFNLTGNEAAAKLIAPTLGVIGGMKYYEFITT